MSRVLSRLAGALENVGMSRPIASPETPDGTVG
jgi:hypothetical protein